jgi:hypothetical protein
MDPARVASRAIALVALVAAVGASATRAEASSNRVGEAAAFSSLRHPTILCPTRPDEIVLAPDVCEGTRGAADPRLRPEQRALGILVLVHKALRVRRWSSRWVEARGECLAIQYADPTCATP